MSLPQFGYSIPPTTMSSTQLLGMSSSTAPSIPSISTSCCENGRPIMTDPHTGQSICSCQYGSGLLSAYSRVPGLPESVYSASPYGSQGYMSLGTDPSAFYSPLNAHYDLKDNAEAWRNLTQPSACYPYDAAMAAYPYGNAYGGMDLNGAARRKNATRETTNTLKAWLYEHRKNPYPTKGEKIMLAIITKMTLTQVSTWFANARRRLKKENKMTWSPRNRCGDGEDDDRDKSGDEDDDTPKEKKDGDDDDDDIDKDCLKDDDSVIDAVIGDAKDLCKPVGGIDVISALDTSNDGTRLPTVSHSPTGPTILHQPKRLSSPCSNSSDSGLSDVNGTLTAHSGSLDHNEAIRPRIWSLAHVATSVSSSSSSTSESKEQTSPLNFSKVGNPFLTQPAGMRPWLESSLSGAASVFPTMSGAYGSLMPHRPKDTTTVTPALNGLPVFSTSSILRPYPQISSIYSSTRDSTSGSLIS